jgi:hypothetical protein
MNAEYCEPSSSFPKMTQHDRHYYLSIKWTWRQFSVRACLVRMFKMTISTMCREHRWFLYPHTRNTCSVQWNVTIPRRDVSSNPPSALSAIKQLCSSVLPNGRRVIGAGDRWWWWCSVSCHVTCGAVWVVLWFGAKRTKTLFRKSTHKLCLFVLSSSVVVASNTHISLTMKGQNTSLINIRSSQFISPTLLITYSYSCVYCVGPCVYAGMRTK